MDGENNTNLKVEPQQETDDTLLKRYRRRKILLFLRSLILPAFLIIVVAAIIAFIYVNQEKLNRDTVRRITTVGSSSYTAIGGAADLGHDRTVRLAPFLEGVIAVSTSEVRYETVDGDSGFSLEGVFSVPGVSVSGGYCLAFDIGGRTLLTADKNGKLASAEVSGEIVSASISPTGRVAVVSSVTGYRSEVSVYDKNLKLIYRWQTPEHYVTSAVVSEDGGLLAAATVYIKNDGLCSAVKLFSLDAEGVIAQSSDYEGLCMSLWPVQNGFGMLLDNAVAMIDTSAEEKTYHPFGADLAEFDFDGEGGIALLLSPQESAERFRLLRISKKGEAGTMSVANDDVTDVAAYGEHTALLRAGSVYLYGKDLKLEKILTPTKLEPHSVLIIDGLRLLLRTDNELLAY